MAHLAMQEVEHKGSHVRSGEHVTDEEYSPTPASQCCANRARARWFSDYAYCRDFSVRSPARLSLPILGRIAPRDAD
jgi:hypothetical protein